MATIVKPSTRVKHLNYKVAAHFSRQQHYHQHHRLLSPSNTRCSSPHGHSLTACTSDLSISQTLDPSRKRSYNQYHHQHHQFRERELQLQTLPFQRSQFITPRSLSMPLSKESAEAIARLRAYKPPPSPWGALDVTRRAAVLILLYADVSGSLRVVLTERSNNLRTFAGQVALPGGKADHLSETPFDTARREAEEEIGLPSSSSKLPKPFTVSHLCEMPTNLSRNNLAVRPCIAFLSSTSDTTTDSLIPRLDPREVQSVFTAPLEPFLRHDYHPPEYVTQDIQTDGNEVIKRRTPSGDSIDEEASSSWYSGYWIDWHTSRWKMHEFQVPARPAVVRRANNNPSGVTVTENRATAATTPTSNAHAVWHDEKIVRYRVWGMTARILVDAARVAYGREPNFECVDGFGDDDVIEELRRKGMLGERKKGQIEESAREGLMKVKAQEKKL